MISRKDRKDLERIRKEILDRREELEEHVVRGLLDGGVAEERMVDEFGKDWRGTLRFIDDTTRPRFSPVAIAVLVAVPFLLLVLGAGITGFAVFQDATTTMQLDTAFTQDTTIVLSTQGEVHGLLASGWYAGNGSAAIVYNGNGTSAVVHRLDARPPGAGTGVVLNAPNTTKNMTFIYRCEQTCNMSSEGPHTVELELDEGILYIESFTILTRAEADLPVPPETTDESESIEAPEPAAPRTNSTSPGSEGPNRSDAPGTSEPVPSTQLCSSDEDCSTGVCVQNVYEGSLQQGVCAPDRSYCSHDGQGTVASGESVQGSTCFGSTQDSAWLADSGRWVWRSADGVTLAVADKHGSMVIRGSLTQGVSSYDDGWHNQEPPSISIHRTQGDLRLAGSLRERADPAQDGIIVRDALGNGQLSMTTQGDILMRGDFAAQVTDLR